MTTHHPSVLESLSGLELTKAHATGNDFIMVADPEGTVTLTPDETAALCDRHFGLGGDGLIRAVPTHRAGEDNLVDQLVEAGLKSSDQHPVWFMDYRNGDGSLAEMCGNGVRAFAHFLRAEGLITLEEGQELPVATRAGLRMVRRVPEGYSTGMGMWSFIDPELAQANASDSLVIAEGLSDPRPALSISMGNPHTVVALPTERKLDNVRLTEPPKVDPTPPHGTNVEFVVPADPLVAQDEERSVGRIRMRVHERGVGETLSCGTGACAAAAAVRVWAGEDGVDTWSVEVPGGEVRVRFVLRDDGAEDVELSGPAVTLLRGTLS